MTRNWGLPAKTTPPAFRGARRSRPLATLGVSALFGVVGAAIAAMSFTAARGQLENLFHGVSLIYAVVAAGFGCWLYIWLARARFIAQVTGGGDAFADLLKFFARAAGGLAILFLLASFSHFVVGEMASVLLLCASGGAGAAAAFQTVLAFVPGFGGDAAA
jgi:hypothetical protein